MAARAPQTLDVEARRAVAAVAHMGAHALGAAGYAGKAAALEAGGDADAVVRSQPRRQVAGMPDAVARARPPLGENTSGPLGPGRLTLGDVGATIREVQRLLLERR